ncbi:MAG: recombination regulator RecX, partial [Rhizobium sp.]
AFARNGFSFEIGKKVFGMSFEDAEEVILSGRL